MMTRLKQILNGIPVIGRFLGPRPLGNPDVPFDADPTHAHFHGVNVMGPRDQPIKCISIDSTKPFGLVIAVPRDNVLGDELMRIIGLNKHNLCENTIILDLRNGVEFSTENNVPKADIRKENRALGLSGVLACPGVITKEQHEKITSVLKQGLEEKQKSLTTDAPHEEYRIRGDGIPEMVFTPNNPKEFVQGTFGNPGMEG